ncbi:MAG: aminoacyl-tRNA hydrolase [Pirellulaceae bacterium]|nr:aminoacyl-tRNA hydrolase [Pirellulaceae bacterium]
MKLIVGLGNPGRRYAGTRHNVGFDVVEELVRRHGGAARRKFESEVAETDIAGQKVLLLSPQTYMNRSGAAVRPARDFYRIENQDVLIVCDDFNLPLARLRLRARGSSGGQKGLADVIRCLGTDELPRLRLGIGPAPPGWDVADYVLSRFGEDDLPAIQVATARAADAVADWVREGLSYCMNRYNSE